MEALSTTDVQTILTEIERFSKGRIAPLVERPEKPISHQLLTDIVSDAKELGILGLLSSEAPKEGFGLWENPYDAGAVSLSVKGLNVLARVNPGTALQLHQSGLVTWLLNQLKFSDLPPVIDANTPQDIALSLQGCYGLGRNLLALYIAGHAMSSDELTHLANYFSASKNAPCVFHSSSWQQLIAPSLDNQDIIQWSLYNKNQLTVKNLQHSHGFDELSTWVWSRQVENETPIATSTLEKTQSVSLYSHLLCMNALGLMSIALGAVEKSYQLAKDYSQIRVQGGCIINQHPAVQLLLANVHSTIQASNAQLNALTMTGITTGSLLPVFSIRSQFHTSCCNAANDALQCFGGLGYMQDTGLEKVVRDNNQLRLMNGTPTELKLFVSIWEGLQ